MSWAEVLGASRIYIGAVQQDSSGYPDCRPEFYRAFNEVIRAGTKEGRIRVETPLIALRKAQIVTLGLELDAPFDLTWSCYSAEDRACGTCDSCVLRRKAFEAAGAVDPISYESPESDLAIGRPGCSTAVINFGFMGWRKNEEITFRVILLTLLVGMCAVPVWAQFTGTVKGSAKDEAGKPLAGATVELVSLDNGRKITLKTNGKGDYFSIGIAPGTVQVQPDAGRQGD